jgi:hypothetical protein
MSRFTFVPELRLRDGRVVRNSDDALELTRASYQHTPGRDEILHWLNHAGTPGQAATAKLIFIAWLQERGLVMMDELSPRPW